MKTGFLYILILLGIATQELQGQACSDPGICTIGSLYSATTADTVSGTDYTKADLDELLNVNIYGEKYHLSAEAGIGFGDGGTSIYSLNLRGSFRLKEKLSLGLKLPFVNTDGVLGNVFGLGDLTIYLQNIFKSGKHLRMAYTLGMVIPTNSGNATYAGAPLPMVYQPSMGFFGALAGLTISTRKWNFVFGGQQNFGRNGNEFTTDNLVLDPAMPGYDPLNNQRTNFASSRKIQNGFDVMLRVERTVSIKKFVIAPGVLPIYRVNNSTIQLPDERTFEVSRSNGLTLNLTIGLSYKVNKVWRINANAGFPVINRENAPDGLRRTAVYLIRLSRLFW